MIKLQGVSKVYNAEVTAVRDASFDILKGEFVFLVGASGSGKSTLLRLMNRQERPEQGEVWVAGRDINRMSDSKVPYSVATSATSSRTTSCCRTRRCSRTSRSPSR